MVTALARLDPDYAKGKFDLAKIDPIRKAFRNHYMVEAPLEEVPPVFQDFIRKTGRKLMKHVYYNPQSTRQSAPRKRMYNVPIV